MIPYAMVFFIAVPLLVVLWVMLCCSAMYTIPLESMRHRVIPVPEWLKPIIDPPIHYFAESVPVPGLHEHLYAAGLRPDMPLYVTTDSGTVRVTLHRTGTADAPMSVRLDDCEQGTWTWWTDTVGRITPEIVILACLVLAIYGAALGLQYLSHILA